MEQHLSHMKGVRVVQFNNCSMLQDECRFKGAATSSGSFLCKLSSTYVSLMSLFERKDRATEGLPVVGMSHSLAAAGWDIVFGRHNDCQLLPNTFSRNSPTPNLLPAPNDDGFFFPIAARKIAAPFTSHDCMLTSIAAAVCWEIVIFTCGDKCTFNYKSS